MEFIGGLFFLWLVGCCVFSLAMRAAGRGDVPDNMAKGMTSWWLNKLKYPSTPLTYTHERKTNGNAHHPRAHHRHPRHSDDAQGGEERDGLEAGAERAG